MSDNKFVDFIKNIFESVFSIIKAVSRLALTIVVIILIISVLYFIVFFSSAWDIKNKFAGTCIEANEFGIKNNSVMAFAKDDTELLLDRSSDYKHESLMQKIRPTDLNLTFNGDPLLINITGSWSPWLSNIESNSDYESKLEESYLYTINNNFLCALERYENNKLNTILNDEKTFYYVKNYFDVIGEWRNDSNEDKEYFGKVVQAGDSIIVGKEKMPEQQKPCVVTRGAGLYLASFGVTGRSEPSAYHHLIADKIICPTVNWFNGANVTDNYVITKYKKPTGKVNYGRCVDIKNSKNIISCESGNKKKLEDRGLCLEVKNDSGKYSSVIYDCKEYQELKYTYADFKKNYFDISYHDSNLLSNTNDIFTNDGYQVIFNIAKYEQELIDNNIENYGYIIASSIEKFMNACYSESESITTDGSDGGVTRESASYFQYGPKQLYKVTNNLYDEPYNYGEKIKLLIVDKLYLDNDGFYQVDFLSGVNLDDYGGIEGKLQEIEYFLLGTPRPGQSNNRDDGVVAEIFNNLVSSEFGTVVKILLAIYVVFWGYRVIFGTKKDDKTDLVNYKELFIFVIKLSILMVLLSPSGFSFFSRTVIGFFVDGTIGLIDLVSNVFDNGFSPDNSSLAAGLQYVDNSLSLSSNFALIDEIAAFFAGDTLTIKVMSFFYNFTDYFFIGIFISVFLMLLLIFYFIKVLSTVIPFVFLLLQLTLLLPLAPFFLLLSFFKHTDKYFKKWINAIIGKCLELFSFFTAFYFFTSLINNIIKELLNFKVCFVLLGDYLMPNVDDSIDVSSATDFFEFNWFTESIKKLLNNFVIAIHTGLGDNYFFDYCVNMLIALCLIFIFGSVINTIMGLMSSIIEVNGQTASNYMSGEINKGIDGQVSEIIRSSGMSNIQDFKPLSWTRNIVDLGIDPKKGGIFSNATKNLGGKIAKSTAGFGQALLGFDRKDIKDENGNVIGKESYGDRWARWAKDTRDMYIGEHSFEKDENDKSDDNLLNVITGGYWEDKLHSDTSKPEKGKTRNVTKPKDALSKYRKDTKKEIEDSNYFKDITDSKDNNEDNNSKGESFRIRLINNLEKSGSDKNIDDRLRKAFSKNNRVFYRSENNTDTYDAINHTISALNNKIKKLKSIKSEIENGKSLSVKDSEGNISFLSNKDSREIIDSLIRAYDAELDSYSDKVQILSSNNGAYQDTEYITDFLSYSEKGNNDFNNTNNNNGTNETLIGGDATSLLTADGTKLLSQKATDLLNQGNQILFDSSNN